MDVVPLQGAIVVCYGWGGEGDDQLWPSGRGAIAGCHCSVLWLGGTTNFAGVIDNTKIGFCYLGSMLVKFFPAWQFPQQRKHLGSEGTFSFEHIVFTNNKNILKTNMFQIQLFRR